MRACRRVELPQMTRLAGERFAQACVRDGCGDFDVHLTVSGGQVVCIAYTDEGHRADTVLFQHDGDFFTSAMEEVGRRG